MNYILEYWEAIESGKVVTSRRVRAVYERLAREIREPDPASPYYFDEDVGERPILFAERFCKQSQGVIGAPLKLELSIFKPFSVSLSGRRVSADTARQCFLWAVKMANRHSSPRLRSIC